MRRGVTATLVAVAVLVTGGCAGGPSVGDGVIGTDWAMMPDPVVPTPEVGMCTSATARQVDWELSMLPRGRGARGCTDSHVSETYHVGTLTDAADDRPPGVGDDLFRDAYEECADEAEEFLGGDFRQGRVVVMPMMPNAAQWRGNARWFRCEALEITSAQTDVMPRKGSLADGLRGRRPLALTCVNESPTDDGEGVDNLTFVDCRIPHDMEFTGVYTAPDGPYPGTDKALDRASDACFRVGARYLGLSSSRLNAIGGIAWLAWGATEAMWAVGDRSYWCFMGQFPRRKLKGSIKGKQPGSFPR
jgi:hypothetical protein